MLHHVNVQIPHLHVCDYCQFWGFPLKDGIHFKWFKSTTGDITPW